MKRSIGYAPEEIRVVTAEGTECPYCGRNLWVVQHRDRHVQRLDAYVHLIRQDTQCRNEECTGPRPLYRPPEDLRFALPRRTLGFDVTLAVGERHLAGETLGEIWRSLNASGVPVDRTSVGRLFRDYLALWKTTRDESALLARLEKQGGAILMADGVQFDGQSPVLYVAWDALSGRPLFGHRRDFRGKDDLVSIFEEVKARGFPVRAIVTDKETGLVPAVKEIFPDKPYQYCQNHFLSNCGKPLDADRSAVGASVTDRASRARDVAKAIHKQELKEKKAAKKVAAQRPTASSKATDEVTSTAKAEATPTENPSREGSAEPAGLTAVPGQPAHERNITKQLCELVRRNSTVSGKAPLDPCELERDRRLEEVRELVDECRNRAQRGGAVPSERWPVPARWVGGVSLAGQAVPRA